MQLLARQLLLKRLQVLHVILRYLYVRAQAFLIDLVIVDIVIVLRVLEFASGELVVEDAALLRSHPS